jgi:hypothetical protein
MMKGTPCSIRDRASLKTLWKTHYLARSSNPAKRVRAWAQSGRCRAFKSAARQHVRIKG